MMTRSEIEQQVIAFLRDTLQLDEAQLVSSANLKADLGLTSLDMQEIMMFCKNTFGFLPTRREIFTMNTLNDVYTLINQKNI
ncbi:MAG: acyl carrier protein [Bacteroidales bacterium]|nr:acyl carrier protein [Candidatus Colicola caccequi]